MSSEPALVDLGVAEAKANFSELIERVSRGERIVITRRGRRVMALVPPQEVEPRRERPLGLAAGAGALADWDELPDVVRDIYEARLRAQDRQPPDL